MAGQIPLDCIVGYGEISRKRRCSPSEECGYADVCQFILCFLCNTIEPGTFDTGTLRKPLAAESVEDLLDFGSAFG